MHPRCLRKALLLVAVRLLLDRLRMVRLVAVDGNRLLDEAFDGLELVALLRRHERDRRARLARARRASNAVDVRLGLERKLHVHDAADVRHVDAAARDIRRDEDADLPLAETLQCAGALVLRLVRVDRRAGDVLAEELFVHAVRAMAHLREDDDLRPLGMRLQEMDQERVLARLLDEHRLLVDLLDGRRLGRDLDLDGIRDELGRELRDRRRHRRREEERLARLRELRDDALDVGKEPHVEHAVRLVEDKALDLVEIEDALRHQVDEPPRARDHRLGALLDVLDLSELADAAEDAGERQVRVGRVALHVLGRLRGEFARRR